MRENLFRYGGQLWQIGASASIILLLVLTLTPGGVQLPLNIPHIDKVYHYISFFAVTLLVDLGFTKVSHSHRIVALIGLGFLIEIIQHFIPGREFSWLDIIADALGVLTVSWIFIMLRK